MKLIHSEMQFRQELRKLQSLMSSSVDPVFRHLAEDGFIRPQTLYAVALRNGKIKAKSVLFWLKRWDLDRDGLLSRAEFGEILD